MPKERIGIMGGSFNPIHARHIEMAACARREFGLERIIFLPTGNPPHKRAGLEDAEHRFEMTRLAVHGKPGFSASRMEIDRVWRSVCFPGEDHRNGRNVREVMLCRCMSKKMARVWMR